MPVWSRLISRVALTSLGATAVGLGLLEGTPRLLETRNDRRRNAELEAQAEKLFSRLPLALTASAASSAPADSSANPPLTAPLPSRIAQLDRLRSEEFDVLVIGGGVVGAGVALDAQTRGLKVALVEKDDFGSSTSSKSTKLLHGGVRYLEDAIFHADVEQLKMVIEALEERSHLMKVAPHISQAMPIMLPLYKWWHVPYFYSGIKMYDIFSWKHLIRSSYFLGKERALEIFPMLKRDKLKGAIVYYEGQMNDARTCLTIAMTATKYGAAIANYCQVSELTKAYDTDLKKPVCSGAWIEDRMTGEKFNIKAKCIINATGPFCDAIRKMDNKDTPNLVQGSSGIHIVLPDYYSPRGMGLIDPATSDGRVIFFLPWQSGTLAGTTDRRCEVIDNPGSSEFEVQFILNEIRDYLSPEVRVRRGDVLATWCGIRPLVRDLAKADTKSMLRNHHVEVSDSNLITITGGKFTTYRAMAQVAVDKAVHACSQLKPQNPCRTKDIILDGGIGFTPNLHIRLVQDYGLEVDVAQHLANTYGGLALKVAKLAPASGRRWPIAGRRLHSEFPYLESEVNWAVREYALTAVDVLARRLRLSFLNLHAAEEALPRIIEIMAKELNWDKNRQKTELQTALKFLNEQMGRGLREEARKNQAINLTSEEANLYVKRFRELDSSNKGYVTIGDIRRYFKTRGESISEDQLSTILTDVDANRNGEIDMGEFLQFMSAWKNGTVSNSRFASLLTPDTVAELKGKSSRDW